MKRKFITAVTSIAIPLTFIFVLQVLNPLISFIQNNTKYHQLLFAVTGVPLAILISYAFNKSTQLVFIPKKTTIKKTFLGLFFRYHYNNSNDFHSIILQ